MHVTSRLSHIVASHSPTTYLLSKLEAYACMPEPCKDVCGFPALKSVCTQIVQHVRQYWHTEALPIQVNYLSMPVLSKPQRQGTLYIHCMLPLFCVSMLLTSVITTCASARDFVSKPVRIGSQSQTLQCRVLSAQEEEEFYKFLPANTADRLCQSWQSRSNHHVI